jgi:NADH-quinone oxidoreductase subunit J
MLTYYYHNEINIYLCFFIDFLILTNALFVVITYNAVIAMFHFILVFIGTALFFAILDMEFMCLMVLLIYVGNIACMFLFVVMMLNVKILELKLSQFKYIPMGLIVCIIFYFTLLMYTKKTLIVSDETTYNYIWRELATLTSSFNTPLLKEINAYSNSLQALGDLIFTEYLAVFIISGLILLVSLIVAILLTLSSPAELKTRQVYMNPWTGKKIEKERQQTHSFVTEKKTLKALTKYYKKENEFNK